jgi:hypothetical protein
VVELWESMKTNLEEAVRAEKKVEIKKNPWITESTWKIVEERKQLWNQALRNTGLRTQYEPQSREDNFINDICANI